VGVGGLDQTCQQAGQGLVLGCGSESGDQLVDRGFGCNLDELLSPYSISECK